MIVGTAGHIDHGKTALVKALTGIDTDRLAEEKRRGITIELGFAHLTLPDGTVAGVVDVPGHERFVKAMVAGAGGVDLAVLAVAADEGVMPQTREHVDICRLLGVRAGVIAVTKADLVSGLGPDWMELLQHDLRALAKDTFLQSAPVVPCSAKTGDGLDALKAALAAQAQTVPARAADGPLYLPVDRAFTMKGFGTVVTGTLMSGTLRLDDQVCLLPGLPEPLRVRGLQTHGAAVERAVAGQRVAVNVADVDARGVRRGAALVRHGELPLSRALDVELTLLPGAAALRKRRTLVLHLGTGQVEAGVALLDPPALAPGATGLAQLRLKEPLAALPGQRFILRGTQALEGRGATLAGGRVLAVAAARKRRSGAGAALKPLVAADVDATVEWLLDEAGYRGQTAVELRSRSGASAKRVEQAVQRLGARGRVVLVDQELGRYVSAAVVDGLAAKARAHVEAFHQRHPLKEGLPLEELRQRLSPELDAKLWAKGLHRLTADGRVELLSDVAKSRGRTTGLTSAEADLRQRAIDALAKWGLAPPKLDELAQALAIPGARLQALLSTAANEGLAAKVAADMYFERRALEQLRERLVAYLHEHREISTQAFKELVGQTRKWVIPLSEYFDREKVTLRVGDKRVLRKG